MATSENLKARKKYNEGFKCDYPGCPLNRDGVSKYCSRHRQANTRTGHPEGTTVKRRQYAFEYEQVSEVIDRNIKHSGVVYCLKQIQSFLDQASIGTKYHHQIARLAATPSVTPVAILKEATAIWHLRESRPYHHPFMSDRHFTYSLGNQIIQLVKRRVLVSKDGKEYCEPVRPEAKRQFGEFLIEVCGPQMGMISKYIQTHQQREQAAKKAMSTPLV